MTRILLVLDPPIRSSLIFLLLPSMSNLHTGLYTVLNTVILVLTVNASTGTQHFPYSQSMALTAVHTYCTQTQNILTVCVHFRN